MIQSDDLMTVICTHTHRELLSTVNKLKKKKA